MLTGKTVFQIKSKAANRFFKKPNQTTGFNSTEVFGDLDSSCCGLECSKDNGKGGTGDPRPFNSLK